MRPEDGSSDLFVPLRDMGSAMHGDRLLAEVVRRPRGRAPEARVVRVLDRARDEVVGVFHEARAGAFVVPLDRRLGREISIVRDGGLAAEDGEVVVVRIEKYGDHRSRASGAVRQVLGRLGEAGVDVLAVALGYGIATDFPAAVEEEAARVAELGTEDAAPGRADRTDLLIFTIDPSDAKDHDDALSFRAMEDGTAEIGVHIADVAYFVTPGSPLDDEALARGTSVYLVDRTIPMLPDVLSGGVCSLHAEADRLAVSLFMVLDREGRVVSRHYERTRIRCRMGLSYEDAQSVLDGRGSVGPDIDAALRGLDDFARGVRRVRTERGALDLDLPEAKVVLDEEGRPVDIQRRARLSSHRLIEDYMVLANEVVANDLEARGVPALYRVHERPAGEKVEELRETLATFQIDLPRRRALKPRDIQHVLDLVRGRPEQGLLQNLILRSLAKARYETENLGHFGLASGGYLHFTSPIRRYPDLVVHRAVVEVLLDSGAGKERLPGLEALAEVADHCSEREQAAEEAERASVALKKVEFMERHLGEVFAGRISGVIGFGLFVVLEDFFVEGLVHVGSLGDDFYRLDPRRHALVGDRGGRGFRLGDRVAVQVARVDKDARQIDFSLVRKLKPLNP